MKESIEQPEVEVVQLTHELHKEEKGKDTSEEHYSISNRDPSHLWRSLWQAQYKVRKIGGRATAPANIMGRSLPEAHSDTERSTALVNKENLYFCRPSLTKAVGL